MAVASAVSSEDAGERAVVPALRALGVRGLDALVVIGGDGTQSIAHGLAERGVVVLRYDKRTWLRASTLSPEATAEDVQVRDALRAGVRVLVEKPLATDLAGARALVSAADKAESRSRAAKLRTTSAT